MRGALATVMAATLASGAAGSAWTTGSQLGLAIVVAPQDLAGEEAPTEAYWDLKEEQLQGVADFFAANSGGAYTLDFEVPRAVMLSDDFSTSDCSSSTSCPHGELIAATVAAAYNASVTYDRIVLLFRGGCSCLADAVTTVLGPVVQVGASDEAGDLADIVARGIAHTNGASRGGRADAPYLTPFSVMGNEASIPEGHLSAVGKLAFSWLDAASNVATFARSGHPECPPADGGSCSGAESSVWIEAHDTGAAFASDKIYAARIFTGLSGAALWVEYRMAHRDTNGANGAILVWALANLPVGPSGAPLLPRYGPAHALPYREGDAAELADYFVPVGRSFVYDLDATAVEVRVLEQDDDDSSSPLSGRIRVAVNMIDRTYERSYPYPSVQEQAETGGPVTVDGLGACGSGRWLQVSNETVPAGLFLYRLFVAKPKDVTFSHLPCTAGGDSTALASLYIYDAYPIQLMRDAARGADFDPAVGAVTKFDVTCDGQLHEKTIALDNNFAVDEANFRPMSLDYYMVFYRDAGLGAAPLSRIWFEFECDDLLFECRDNFYANRTGDCVQCPLGKKSVQGARDEAECYETAPSVALSWNTRPELDGTYVQTEAAHGGAPVFVRASPSTAYMLKDSETGTWGVLTAAALAANDADPDVAELPVLTSLHTHPLAAGTRFESEDGVEVIRLSAASSSPSSAYVDPYGNSFLQTYLGWDFHEYTPSDADLTGSSAGSCVCGSFVVILAVVLAAVHATA